MTNENSSNNKPAGQKSPNSGRDKSAERQERTAQALRDNLRRRKVQKKAAGDTAGDKASRDMGYDKSAD